MKLHKTDKARAELKPGSRGLGQRERTLLLLANGTQTASDFRQLFEGEGEQIALRLQQEGYLETHEPAAPVASAPSAAPELAEQAEQAQPAVSARPVAPPEKRAPVATSVDQFEGKRSMATTRMFLFDICERMFSRRDPALANHFREALRQAKDRESMLEAARAMINEIEKAAGPERADSISERIAMLLPQEVAA